MGGVIQLRARYCMYTHARTLDYKRLQFGQFNFNSIQRAHAYITHQHSAAEAESSLI